MQQEEVLLETKWLGLYRKSHWDYAKRPNSTACVGILATTAKDDIILIEQFRIPVEAKVIEIPAGLVGDEVEHRDESMAETAKRELLEETGYEATEMKPLISSPTSAGMTPEITHIFHARGLNKKHTGGGVSGEDITTHVIPISSVRAFLASKQQAGFLIDFKIHAALAAAGYKI